MVFEFVWIGFCLFFLVVIVAHCVCDYFCVLQGFGSLLVCLILFAFACFCFFHCRVFVYVSFLHLLLCMVRDGAGQIEHLLLCVRINMFPQLAGPQYAVYQYMFICNTGLIWFYVGMLCFFVCLFFYLLSKGLLGTKCLFRFARHES